MKRILIIDDDSGVSETVSELLRKSSFDPLVASSGKQGIQVAAQAKPDLILLDVNMPEMDGYAVCKQLRQQPSTREIPIIMLTAEGGIENSVKGLDIGADDYIIKPFNMKDLMARIHARLRKIDSDKKHEGALTFGEILVDPKTRKVMVACQKIKLTQMEFELLRYFIENPDRLIATKNILSDLWPDSVVTERTIDTHLANLKKKIKDFGAALETIYGSGYILKIKK